MDAGAQEACCVGVAAINSAAFAPTIIAGALVLPDGTVGKIEAPACDRCSPG